MADDHGTLRAIAWQQVFPSLRLFSALRMALNFKALVLAAIAVAGMVAGWRILGNLFADSDNPSLAAQIAFFDTWPWEVRVASAPLERLVSLETWPSESPLLVAWNQTSAPFRQMYQAPSFANFAYLLCCALWSLLVWAFFGACITRLAAVSFARRENASLGQLAAFVSPRLSAYFVAPLFPILGTFLMALFMAALGALMRTDVGVILASLAWPLVLLGSFVMAFLLLGLFFGFPLMWGSISAEGTDSFGALSHSYSYVYQRPLLYLAYAVIAGIIGVLGSYLVSLFSLWILELSRWGVSWGSGAARFSVIEGPESMGPIADTGAAIIAFWTNCVHTLAFGFIFSYFWSATTVIYFLLRRQVDATELDEVYMPDEHDQHGLPPLKTGPDGMPAPVDDPEPLGAC
ncbi:MAG: hypothetical protein WD063_08990 [Pirellulales bacterium]